ncbi:cytochrome d ubiquinol oxidase subunit II [Heliophilum fasciatum]|uniref:Cytochrome bd-I ubiquinol oxidase subunit 2 apoprotein n=1 Tax=Heliophilum fasciatum TaxID=35700 RepID=A0A4R2RWL0_9FIRM|nr:cytochrome d ubiquinol oxidase subunit II [Heliophilum fasciatum]MCW2276769.1 cytochrome d ubiquinol oxidase subunit II [Heliophilum fasciatum]TCP68850.1 cytochrome bd-I ubiquinol oxidase subunit 2 apoprotein [Heliophilum fasciatum]
MTMEILQITWFLLVAVLIVGYALLDGFDLGVGCWHLFTNDDQERETMIASIGPYWDSNQVWLLTGGGAIFAAFPMVYATVFSGFYLALILLLLGLIFRAVSIEFQHQVDSPRWRHAWDLGFSFGSILPSFLFGVAMGNILRGVPVDAAGNYAGDFLGLLNPYSLVMGLLSLAMFSMHGAAFLIAQTDGELVKKARLWARSAWLNLAIAFVVATVWSFLATPRLFANFQQMPVLYLFPVAAIAGLAYFPVTLRGSSRLTPLMTSGITIVGLLGIVAAGLFPYLVPSSLDLSYSLTAFNASSSERTLTVMSLLALIGLPIVLAYTFYIYRAFAKAPKYQHHS